MKTDEVILCTGIVGCTVVGGTVVGGTVVGETVVGETVVGDTVVFTSLRTVILKMAIFPICTTVFTAQEAERFAGMRQDSCSTQGGCKGKPQEADRQQCISEHDENPTRMRVK